MIQYDNKITAKTLALSLDETDEYEYLTGEKYYHLIKTDLKKLNLIIYHLEKYFRNKQ